MSNEEIQEKTEDRPRGNRGELGEATATLTLKQRYHEAHFQRVDANDKHNPARKVWIRNPGAPSLKQFARKLIASGDANAKEWFARKNGSMNAKRSDANIKIAHEAFAATKMERRKKSAGSKGGGK